MKRMLFFLIAVGVGIFLVGCGTDGQQEDKNNHTPVHEQIGKSLSDNGDSIKLVGSEKNVPADFDETALQREEAPYYQYLVKKAENQSDYEASWDLYELENEAPPIDFDNEDAFFFGYYESGFDGANCPIIIDHITMNSDHTTMTVSLEETYPNDGCDDIATPRTSVIQISKEISKNIEQIMMEEDGAETTLSLDI